MKLPKPVEIADDLNDESLNLQTTEEQRLV